MNFLKSTACGAVLAASSFVAAPVAAVPLDIDTGWVVFSSGPLLGNSWADTFEFTLSAQAELKSVDMCTGGDAYDILNFGVSIGTTTQTGSSAGTSCLLTAGEADAAFAAPQWDTATFLLGPGSYRIGGTTIVDGSAGPNRAAIRLDTAPVPVPASILLLGFGMASFVAVGRKRK